jgi:putative SOS response-associated peptidase YedK
MPLLLPHDKALDWLRPDLNDAELRELISYEFPQQEMEVWPVNTIRTRKEDTAKVIAPLDASLFPAL